MYSDIVDSSHSKSDFLLGPDFLAHVLALDRRREHSSVDHAARKDWRMRPEELAEEVEAEGTKTPGNS